MSAACFLLSADILDKLNHQVHSAQENKDLTQHPGGPGTPDWTRCLLDGVGRIVCSALTALVCSNCTAASGGLRGDLELKIKCLQILGINHVPSQEKPAELFCLEVQNSGYFSLTLMCAASVGICVVKY